jgi:hypothetical protein
MPAAVRSPISHRKLSRAEHRSNEIVLEGKFCELRHNGVLGRPLWVKLLLHHRLGRQVVIGSSCQCTTFQVPSSAHRSS